MLHKRSDVADLLAPSYSRLDTEALKYQFPDSEMRRDAAYQLVADEISMDGNARQNLATFCQTWESEQVHQLMELSINKNLIDKDEYPRVAEIERRCVHMLADLWNCPDSHDACGTSAIGSSEACMLAGMAMLRRWRSRRSAAGQPTDRPNLVCGPVQVVWHKFARYWDIELREVGMGHHGDGTPRFCMEPDNMVGFVDENTIGVVPTLGVTYTGAYEPVAALAAALDSLQERTGLDVEIHVDAASGGFTAPFCAPDLEWDFRVPRVISISTSGHKFGLAPLGVGWVVFRSPDALPDELVFHVTYLGGDMPTFQINFSRPAGQIVAQYYDFVRLGRAGYSQVHGAAYRSAAHLAERIPNAGPFELVFDGNPATGIPAVTWRLADDTQPGWTLFELADRLRSRGWQVPAYPLTGALSGQIVQRALIRQDVSRDQVDILIDDLADAVSFLDRHPTSVPMSVEEAGNFHH